VYILLFHRASQSSRTVEPGSLLPVAVFAPRSLPPAVRSRPGPMLLLVAQPCPNPDQEPPQRLVVPTMSAPASWATSTSSRRGSIGHHTHDLISARGTLNCTYLRLDRLPITHDLRNELAEELMLIR
jgi:hypothetical protein